MSMKLVINNYKVGFWDTLFIAMSWFWFVMAACEVNFDKMIIEFLLFTLFVEIAVLKSKKFHLENRIEKLSSDSQET